jgi:type I restriction enzyme S subunit
MTDWPVKTLGEVCDLVGGGTPSKDRPEFYGGEIPWATVRDLNVEVLRSTEHSITAEAVKSSSSNIIPSGSVVIATRVGLGKAVIVAQDTAINQDLRGLVVKKPKELLAEYLYWWYLSTVHLVVAAGTGATVQGVKLPFVSGLAIPVPPLEEQKRIVALLDAATVRITELTACYEQARTHANNLFASSLRDSLASNPDWPVKTLGEVCSIKSVLVDPKDLKYSGMIHIGAGNIEAKTGRLFGIKTAREEKLISGKFLYSENDVLYSKIRPYLEKVALPAQAGLCSADVYPLQPGPLLTRMFLFYTLVSETFTEYAISGSSRTGMPKVNREHLFKYEMKVPPLAVQTEIVERLDATRIKKSEMVAAYDAKLTSARNLRQSILEAAFTVDL